MDTFTFLVLASLALAAVTIPNKVADWHREKARALREWAERNGWRYEEKRSDLVDCFTGTPFRKRGGNVGHVLAGSHRGFQVLQYQYSSTVFTGGTPTTRTFRITVVPTPVTMPIVEAEDGRVWRAIRHILGTHTVGFDDGEFDAIYGVVASDEGFARAVLTPDIRAWLAGLPPEGRFPFRFTGDHVICWKSALMGYELDLQPVNFLADLCEQLPSEVWERPWRD
ncbi:hypothetical protein O4J56_10370 [Nocardiopsis sp. RSe5-2]|uniref:DUF3137 domain-containing protein n=1 Tax=Nocardiopsis endophytica TaxID=3018445 RepID=A0ABT4U3M4_9ACTN|nr:hypothetical protein [Nocardiopsis endophytica]MDA2811040.1 hypothetical protein [Nocardiopsis endophytica]